jgi:hypothetical protein
VLAVALAWLARVGGSLKGAIGQLEDRTDHLKGDDASLITVRVSALAFSDAGPVVQHVAALGMPFGNVVLTYENGLNTQLLYALRDWGSNAPFFHLDH